jgi:ADP-heptose:LPS heptosyltransferase
LRLSEKREKGLFVMPDLTICQMAAAFKKCALVVCNDSGPMHVGVAVGTPTVAIFGPTFPDRFGPKDLQKNRVVRPQIPCSPCWHPDKAIGCLKGDCLLSIEVERVLAAVNELSHGVSP